jgi:hypothetical protein
MLTHSASEILHTFLQPIRNRLDHYVDAAKVLAAPYLDWDKDTFDEVATVVDGLVSKGENVLLYTDAVTDQAAGIQITHANDVISFINCYLDPNDATKLIPDFLIGSISLEEGEIILDGSFKASSLTDSMTVMMKDLAEKAVDNSNIYTIMDTAVTSILARGELNGPQIMESVKSKIGGVKNMAYSFMQDFSNVMDTGSLTGFITLLQNYLKDPGLTINASGTISFTEIPVTKEWASGIILGGLGTIITLAGMVLSAICPPIGVAVTAIGVVTNTVTNVIAQAVNSDSHVKWMADVDGLDVGFTLPQISISYGQAGYNTLGDFINGKGPQAINMLGLRIKIWGANPNKLDVLNDPNGIIRVEITPSCEYYVPQNILVAFEASHFTTHVDVVNQNPSGQYWFGSVKIDQSYSIGDLFDLYNNNAVYADYDASDETTRDWLYSQNVVTAICFLTWLMDAEKEAGDMAEPFGSGNTMYLANCGASWFSRFVHGGHTLPWSSGDYNVSHLPTDEDGNINFSDLSQAAHNNGSNYTASQIVPWIRKTMVKYNQASQQSRLEMYGNNFTYTIINRAPLKVLPMSFTLASFIVGSVLLATLTIAVATVVALSAVAINRWRSRAQALTQAKTEKAWQNMVDNPTVENANAYRAACFKQNTLGKIFGCSSVNNKNYWGGDATDFYVDFSPVISILK